MNNSRTIMQIIDDYGLMRVEELVERSKLSKQSVRIAVRHLRLEGFLQVVYLADESGRMWAHYAGTSKAYQRTVESHKAVALYANDGCVWIFPSLSEAARFKRIAQPTACRAMQRGYKLRGERIEELNP